MNDYDDIKNLAISETGFVFDPRSGATFTVNPTGLLVLNALREGASPDSIAGALKARFEGAGDEVREDVGDFLHLLRQSGLLPPVEEKAT
jgi:PqqD family protein of HPr-rel-A system